MKKIAVVLIIFTFLSSFSQGSARTRETSIENFIESLRLTDEGFANTLQDNVNIISTTQALQVTNVLGKNVNNTLNILLFYQKNQNDSGGFSNQLDKEVAWPSTIKAVEGLQYLDVNQSQIQNWSVFNYINSTVFDMLYLNSTIGNSSIIEPRNLTISVIDVWSEYILTSFRLGFPPTVDVNFLISNLQSMQYSNGSYIDLIHAVKSIELLTLLDTSPKELDLASKFIRAHVQNDGAFSQIQGASSSLLATYQGILGLYLLKQVHKLEYRDELLRFILDLQHTNSGFGEINTQPTLQSTWIAIQILFMMNELNELQSPDVLQTQGFISFPFMWLSSLLILRRKRNG